MKKEHEHKKPVHHVRWDDGISPEEEKAIEEGLAVIYGEERDDLAKVDKAGSRLTRYLLRAVSVLAVLVVLVSAGVFVYFRYLVPQGEDPLTLTLEVPTDAVSGASITMQVQYENTGKVPIVSAEIDLNLPDAFVVTSVEPQPTDAEELLWQIGSMERSETGVITLQGTWIASVPSTKNVQALATYRPANFNANFDAVATSSITTVSSTLAITATGTEQVMPGASATYDVIVTNTGTTTMPLAFVSLDLPEGFFIDAASPELAAGSEPVWTLGDLAPEATHTITITGSFASTVSDVQQLRAVALVQQEDGRLAQAEASVFTDVEGNGLVVQLVGNGTADDVTMDPGDPLRLTIGYENTGETPLSGISLLIDFQADGKIPITWNATTLDGGRLTAEGVRFDNLTLAIAEEKMKNLIFPVHETLADGDVQSWTVVVHATLSGVTIKSRPLTVALNSDTVFSAVSRYYDASGAPLGDGPLPPEVGETTTYEIVWTLVNELHALRDVRATATIPANVDWVAGAADYGAIEWDPGTRTVSWTMSSLGEDAGALTATLRVSVTPESDDVGKFIKLLSGTSFRATDTVTSSSIQQTTGALSTECEGDAAAEGRGYVGE